MQFCITCGVPLNFAVEKANARSIARKIRNKVFFWSCVVYGLLGAASTLLVPPGDSAMLKANMCAVAARGKDIYVAVANANTERKPLGLPSLWPKTYLASTNIPTDISGRIFKTSTEYFAALYDEEHIGTEAWKPWVSGFDFSKLAGAGIFAKVGGGRLTAKNNMWLIAANITDEDEDIIPVLITRNVDAKEIERIINQGGSTSNLNTRIAIGAGEYKTPFGKKGFVLVRKGGGTFNSTAKYATVRYIFNSETLPPRDPSKPKIVYLLP
jgi:hypothetical protein